MFGFDLKLKVIGIAVLALVLYSGAFGWYMHHKGYKAGETHVQGQWNAAKMQDLLEGQKDTAQKQAISDSIDMAATITIEELNRKNIELQKRLYNEISQNRAYNDCLVSDNGVLLYNENAIPANRK